MRSIRARVGDLWWHIRFGLRHPATLRGSHPERLRLVLGVGRSGTSWVSAVLSHSATPLRYVHEPLFHIDPPLSLASGHDHTAIRYQRHLPSTHRLLIAYRGLTLRSLPSTLLSAPDLLVRDDDDWQLCLVKEVHALLATEALLEHFQIPCLILLRDPLFVVDSLFAAQGTSTPYLVHEARAVRDPRFLERYAPDVRSSIESAFLRLEARDESRFTIAARKTLTVALIQRMLKTVGKLNEKAHVLRYEWLCTHPMRGFREAADRLSLEWNASAERFLETTMRPVRKREDDPYSLMRSTPDQPQRPLRFLSTKEREAIQDLLVACGVT